MFCKKHRVVPPLYRSVLPKSSNTAKNESTMMFFCRYKHAVSRWLTYECGDETSMLVQYRVTAIEVFTENNATAIENVAFPTLVYSENILLTLRSFD